MAALEEATGQAIPLTDDDDAVAQLRELCRAQGIDDRPPYTTAVLFDRLVGKLIEPQCIQPTFLCDHPISMSPLASPLHRSINKNGATSGFEMYFAIGYQHLWCRGSQPKHVSNPDAVIKKFNPHLLL